MQVLGDVAVVVIIHERMTVNRIVERERNHREQQACNRIPLLGIGKQADLVLGRQQLDLTTEDSTEHRGGNTEGTAETAETIDDY